jgi:diguanylate cyclase (GGDEF)-like protein/PAS domain S-box-containing protein
MPNNTTKEEQSGSADIYFKSIVEAVREPLVVLNEQLRVVSANAAFYRLFHVSPAETEQKYIYELGSGQWGIDGLRDLLEKVIPFNEQFSEYEVDYDFPVIGHRTMLLNGRKISQAAGREQFILVAIEDRTETKRVAAALEETRKLVENSPDAVARYSPDGRYVYVNRAGEKLGGRPRDEIIGKTPEELGAAPDVAALFSEAFRRVFETKKKVVIDIPFAGRIYQGIFEPETGPQGTINSIAVYSRDVTETRKATAELRKSEKIVQNVNSIILITDREGNITFINNYGCQFFGFATEELIGKNVVGTIVPETESTGRQLNTLVRNIMADPDNFRTNVNENIKKNGERVWISWTNSTIVDDDANSVATFSVGNDVTELKKTQDALRESEEKYRTLVERANDGIIIVQEGVIIYGNPRMAELDGGTVDQLVGTPLTDHIYPDEIPKVIEFHRRRMKGEKVPATYETVLRRRNGSPAPAEVNAAVINFGGKLADMVLIRDVTERKRADESLKRHEREYRALAENSPDVICRFDRAMRHVYVNDYGAKVYGVPKDRVVGKTMAGLGLPPDKATLWNRHLERVFESRKQENVEFEFESPGLGHQYFLTVYVPEFDDKGNVGSVLAISRDFTQIKKVQKLLSDAVQKEKRKADEAEEGRRILDAIMKFIKEGIMIADVPGSTIRMVSEYGRQLLGRPIKELYNVPTEERPARWGVYNKDGRSLARPDELPLYRSMNGGEVVEQEEWLIKKPDGSLRTFSFSAAPILNAENKIIGAVSGWRDISEQRRTEETLRRREYEMRTLVDNSPDLIFRLDRQMQYVYANPAYERLTGIPREQFAGKTNSELGMPLQAVEFWRSVLQKVIESGREYQVEFDMSSFFGKRYFSARLIPEFEKSGLVETVLVIGRDITESKHAEERIRYISFHDKVTGLYNRAYFEEELRRLDTERELPMSIIFGDVNNLKLTNDTLGHAEGDKMLQRIASLLRVSCRRNDIIARWGGDEFTVILPKTGLAAADEIYRRIKEECSRVDDMLLQPSIAIGVATKEHKNENIYRTIREAESRMYGNKAADSRQNQEIVIEALLTEVERRRHESRAHTQRLRGLVAAAGSAMGLSDRQAAELDLLAYMHDIGHVVVSEEILSASRRLSPREWDVVRKSPEAGYRIARSFSDLAPASDSILACREHWDGRGYPRGLRGEDIPFLARVLAILDTYDVMTHERPYAHAVTHEAAVRELRDNAGKQFDPRLVEVFLRKIEERSMSHAGTV